MSFRFLPPIILVAMGVVSIAVTVLFSGIGMLSFPEPDFVQVLVDIETKGIVYALWVQIEGHRMVFSRLLLLADYFWFGGVNWLTFFAIIAMTISMFAGSVYVALRRVGESIEAKTVIFCLMALLVFGPYYTIYGTQQYACYSVILFFSMASIGAFWRGLREEKPLNRWLSFSLLLLLIAGFSGLPGMLVFPVLIFMAIAHRRWQVILPLCATVAVFVLIFGIAAEPTSRVSSFSLVGFLLDPVHTLTWISRYIGSVFGTTLFLAPFSQFSAVVSVVVGLIGILLAIVLSIHAILKPETLSRAEGLLTGIMILSMLWILGAVSKHAQPDTEIQFLDPYIFMAGWFWATMIALLIIHFRKYSIVGPVSVVLALLLSIVFIPVNVHDGLQFEARGKIYQLAKIAIQVGVDDRKLFAHFNLNHPSDSQWKTLRERKYPPFDGLQKSRLGFSPKSLPNCEGKIIQWKAVATGGWRVWGTLPKAVKRIQIINRENQLIGVGRSWQKAMVPKFLPEFIRSPVAYSWWGYSTEEPGPTSQVLGINSSGMVTCQYKLSQRES